MRPVFSSLLLTQKEKTLSLRLDTNENKNYFTIQLIFAIIYEPHCTF